MGLDFGLLYEIEIAKPFHERSEYEVYKQVIAQTMLAEEAGFEYFWTVEHHFLTEFSHCSAPECLYPYIAAKTKTIRIGHGVRLLPFPYNHPVRAAEMAATLDLVCDGRLEFGTGRSVSWDEIEGFGIDPKDTRGMWEEALEVIVGCWTNEVFSWEGKYFKLPPRSVIPKPFQKPHPRIWCASTGPETHEIAGRKGLGLLSFTLLVDPEELKRRIGLYRGGIAEAKPVGKFLNNRAGTFTITHCAATNAEARRNAEKISVWYVRRALELVASVAVKQSGREDMGGYEYIKEMVGMDPESITFDYLDQNDMIIVGDPDRCIQKVKRYQEAGVDMLLPMMQVYDLPHSKVMDSIHLWGKYVIPYFR